MSHTFAATCAIVLSIHRQVNPFVLTSLRNNGITECGTSHTCASRDKMPVAQQTRATSIKDIARLAHVSHSTVSRALHGSQQVSVETAARIRKIADEAGYRASAAARSLVMGRTNTIGVVVTN